MKRRFLILIVSFLAILAGIITHAVLQPPEPAYQGKRLGQYLEEMASRFPTRVDDPAVESVYRMGPAAIPYLKRTLRRKDSVQVKGLHFLHAHLPGFLERHLSPDPDPVRLRNVATAAAVCLAAFGPAARDAVPELLEAFKELPLINYASSAIRQIGPKPEDLPKLLDYLTSTNWGAPTYAAQLIGMIGVTNSRVLISLTNLAALAKDDLRQSAIAALGVLGPQAGPFANPVLSRNLSDPDRWIRVLSAGAMWRVQGQTNPPIRLLMTELESELKNESPTPGNPGARDFHYYCLLVITHLLKEIGPEASPTASLLRQVELTKGFSNPDVSLPLSAVDALWHINHETNELVTICIDSIRKLNGPAHRAAELLSAYCIENHFHLPELDEMLKNNDRIVQFYAAYALWKTTGDAEYTITNLLAGLENHTSYYPQSKELRRLAAEMLSEMGPKATVAIPALKFALNDPEVSVRTAITNALIKVETRAER